MVNSKDNGKKITVSTNGYKFTRTDDSVDWILKKNKELGMQVYFSDRGNKFNEDFVYATPSFGFVVDGASGVSKNILTDYNTDAQALSHTFGQNLALLVDETDKTTKELIDLAFSNMKLELYDGIEIPEDYLSPSATFSYFRIFNEQLEIGWIGDSPVVVWFKDGHVEKFWDEIITKNDDQAIAQMYKYIFSGDSIEVAHDKIMPVLAKNRVLKNVPGGYWSLDPSGVGLQHLYRKSFPLRDVAAVAVMSDGFYRLVDVFSKLKLENGFNQVGNYAQITKRVDELRKLEMQTDSMLDYPRFKISDDASIAVLSLN